MAGVAGTGDGRGDRWNAAVEDVVDRLGWDLGGTEYSPDGGNLFGGSVVAEVGDGRIVFDVQTYADGEYSTDPDWQMGVAGSTTPGTSVPEVTLFLTDEAATAVRRAIVVSPLAIVMVHAEFIPSSELPDTASFETAARQLAARLPNVLGNDN
jgi:hypothetical protein